MTTAARIPQTVAVRLHIPVAMPGVDDLDTVAAAWRAVVNDDGQPNPVAYIDRRAGQVVAVDEWHLNVANADATLDDVLTIARRTCPDADLSIDTERQCVTVTYSNGERP